MEWSEINAAWGQTALLLWALARKVGITFNKYQVVPYGSYSYIKNLTDEKTLPLYGSGGFRMIFDSKFDSVMVAFLDCLTQFANEVNIVKNIRCFYSSGYLSNSSEIQLRKMNVSPLHLFL